MFKVKTAQTEGEVRLNVRFVDGSSGPIVIKPNDGALDKNGNLRTMTLYYNDGQPLHLVLGPRNATEGKILSFVRDWLIPAGIAVVASRLIVTRTNKSLQSIGQSLFRTAAAIPMLSLLDDVNVLDCAYFDISNGEKVITDPAPIKVRLTANQERSLALI